MTITRFAPSPTGLLHIGNTRTALISWLFARHKGGQFMLRMDDTDLVRSKDEYQQAIIEDLKWLGLNWDIFAKQSDRLADYDKAKQKLLQAGRLYPCYESQEELEIKRKMQLSRGAPPIYDRAALKLTSEQKTQFEQAGKKPHFRFLLEDGQISWNDQIKGHISFASKNLSDPILIREDGTMTYILSSVVDDIDFAITDIIRGEDHVANTAIQIQIFASLGATPPNFAHLALIKSKDSKISKREGGFDVKALRELDIEPMAICSLMSKLGTSLPVEARSSMDELISDFNMNVFGKAPASYDQEDLERLNQKLMMLLPFEYIAKQCDHKIDQMFWDSVKPNLSKVSEVHDWWQICKEPLSPIIEDPELLKLATELLPSGTLDENSWSIWVKLLQAQSGKQGKALFMPIRKALTGMEHGPELKILLPLIGREKILKRLNGQTS